jgi:ribonucleoside-diphosphate reductase alpha chain
MSEYKNANTGETYKISLDLSRDELFDTLGKTRLRDSYMKDEEVSPQERFAFVSAAFASNQEHAQRLYDYSSKHWLSYSTPILSSGKNKRGLPVSCYLNFLEDTSKDLVNNLSETNWLSMMGGGVGVHVGIRGADNKSVGVMPHLKTYDACTLAYKQGSRRGSYAMYLDISHPDIIQFLEMRKPTGDQNLRTLNLHHAVNIPDKFMQIIENCMIDSEASDEWELIQPNTGKVQEVVSAKTLWMKLLELRLQTGEPYIWFIDRANEGVPEYQKAIGLKNHGSNLCSEVSLVTSPERTAVCCLSSVNLEYFDEWKTNELFLADTLEMLDNVLTYFISNAPDEISRARFSAERERSVGVGALGFHAYLQQRNIAFEGVMAKSVNNQIFHHIRSKLDTANEALAIERGACPDAADFDVLKRCSHVMAIAPNASSSIIMGNTSPSIEPFAANAYRQDTSSGAFLTKNKYLDKLFTEMAKEKGQEWYDDVWASVVAHDGSVQHLEELDEYTKDVFKTGIEIDQRWVVEHSSDRQKKVDQAISTNIFLRPDVSVKYLHAVHFQAWKQGLNSMYYVRSAKLRKADKVGQSVERQRIEDEIDMQALVNNDSCLACEG